MTKKTELVWARDRVTGKKGEYAPAAVAAFPSRFYRLPEPPKSKPSRPAPVSVPKGTDKERSE